MFSTLPFYLSSWMVILWLYSANAAVQAFVVKDLHGASGQIHKTPYLSGIFTGTAVLVALRWSFHILPCTFTCIFAPLFRFCPLLFLAFEETNFGGSNILPSSTFKYRLWNCFRDGNVLFRAIRSLGSRMPPSTRRDFRTKKDCGGIGCSR